MKKKCLHTICPAVFLFLIGISCIILFSMLSGCTSGSASPSVSDPALSGTDVIIPVSSPKDIEYVSSMQKRSTPPGVYEGLVIKDRFGQFAPALARNWTVSSDAKTWTFHLAEDARWNDGIPFSCEDVKFTSEYLKANNLTLGFVLKDVKSVDCPDEHTAVITLKTSYSGFLNQISRQPGITISPAHFWKNITDPQHYRDSVFTGTGPFIFDKSAAGYVRLKTNNAYHGRIPRVSGVILTLITNTDSQVLALKNGEVDVVSDISPVVARSLSEEKDISVYAINDTGAYEVAFNMARYPSNITAFRDAMSHAVDRDTVSSLFGTGRPNPTTFLIPGLAGDYVNPADVGMYDYNLTKAGEILKSAGFTRNPAGILLGPDGNPVTIPIPVSSKGGSGNQKVIAVIKHDWEKLGITVNTISFEDQTQFRKAVNENPVFIDAFPVTLHDDADALVNFAVTPTQETNYYNYNNPEYNHLVSRIQDTSDRIEIKRLAYQMQDILARDIPTVPVCTTDTLVAYRNNRFTGWDIGPGFYTVTDPRVLENLTPVMAR